FFSSRRRHTRWPRDWSSDVCSSDLCNVKSTRGSLPTSRTTFWRSTVLKPLASARTVYFPGCRLGALYSPASSVVSARDTPLSTSRTVTVAPAITPPVWSVTVPRIRPELPCEKRGRQTRSMPSVALKTRAVLLVKTQIEPENPKYEGLMRRTPFFRRPNAQKARKARQPQG